jgi:hypothetical protein
VIEVDAGEQSARRSGIYACVLNAGGMGMEWMVEQGVAGIPWWPTVLSGAIGIGLLVALLAARRAPRLRLGSAVFLLNALAVIAALWVTANHYVASGRHWTPFEANKLGAITIALLAPSSAVGLAGIAGYAGGALLQYGRFPDPVRASFPVAEPWATVAYSAFAVALLAFRQHHLAVERAAARRHAEADALQRFARTALALRDLSNTPLQTLELSLALLRERPENGAAILKRIENALVRLRALREALSRYETGFNWASRDLTPDSAAIIRDDDPDQA